METPVGQKQCGDAWIEIATATNEQFLGVPKLQKDVWEITPKSGGGAAIEAAKGKAGCQAETR